jgi:hypothetical protein
LTNKIVNPQPTQQIPQEFTWHEASTNFVNQIWGHDGQGSTWDADQNNTITEVHDFLGLNEDEPGQLYGRGYRHTFVLHLVAPE